MIFHVRRVIPPYFCIMKTVFNGIMKNKWTKLAALAIAALWSGPTVQAQAPHPERIYLSGTGIDNTKTWGVLLFGRTKQWEMEKDRSTLQLGTARIRRIYLRSLVYYKR